MHYTTDSVNSVSDSTESEEPAVHSNNKMQTSVAVDDNSASIDAEVRQSALSNSQTIPQFAKEAPVAYDAAVSDANTMSTDVDKDGARMMMQSE